MKGYPIWEGGREGLCECCVTWGCGVGDVQSSASVAWTISLPSLAVRALWAPSPPPPLSPHLLLAFSLHDAG